MQTIPRCFGCQEQVEYDPIFEPPCGADHELCRSAIWHPLCLMKYREHYEQASAMLAEYVKSLSESHCPHGHERGCPDHSCED